ncbi:MAG: hypothetical protein KF699_04160 [Phycisphaeraceae bacterium]|nr:hypothetical protein [Phycisphaeraceae bacterium]
MTRLMEQAIERLRAVPESQQDKLAEFLLHELAEDQRWTDTSSANGSSLKSIVDQVLADDAAGRCEPRAG